MTPCCFSAGEADGLVPVHLAGHVPPRLAAACRRSTSIPPDQCLPMNTAVSPGRSRQTRRPPLQSPPLSPSTTMARISPSLWPVANFCRPQQPPESAPPSRTSPSAYGSDNRLHRRCEGIRLLVLSARQTVARGVNLLRVQTNDEIGPRIVEHEQAGADRAQFRDLYGSSDCHQRFEPMSRNRIGARTADGLHR
jgi:hypothetical protein